MEDLNNHQPDIKFIYILSVKIVSFFLIWTTNYWGVILLQIYISKVQIDTNIYILPHPTQNIPSTPMHVVKHLE